MLSPSRFLCQRTFHLINTAENKKQRKQNEVLAKDNEVLNKGVASLYHENRDQSAEIFKQGEEINKSKRDLQNKEQENDQLINNLHQQEKDKLIGETAKNYEINLLENELNHRPTAAELTTTEKERDTARTDLTTSQKQIKELTHEEQKNNATATAKIEKLEYNLTDSEAAIKEKDKHLKAEKEHSELQLKGIESLYLTHQDQGAEIRRLEEAKRRLFTLVNQALIDNTT